MLDHARSPSMISIITVLLGIIMISNVVSCHVMWGALLLSSLIIIIITVIIIIIIIIIIS